ncbi:MAG: pyridoxal phosphate-dependent aminotransferase [Bacteroides sp.]|jgi:aspartate aminotransferase|nr:pyridoxal phosphate-dependent aminotransferase [Bacteroides sp.]
MITLSNRITKLSESETLAMARKSRELKAQGYDVINLSLGEPDFFTPDFVKTAAKKAIDENFSFYTPVNGYLELRQAISHKLKRDNNLDYSPDQIVVSTGAKQALINTLLCLVNPGDEVIVASPYWVSYRDMVKLAEGEAVYVTAGIENDFKITPAQLEAAITLKTKVFMFSSPCNPTGSVYSREELKALAEVFEKHPHVFILSDEIYEHINFSGSHESIAQFESVRDRVIIINGVSKGFSMTGWRVGYLAAHLDIAKACTKLQGQFTSGTNSIAQRATIAAVEADPANTIPMLEKFRERRDLVLDLMKDIPGLITNKPEGAFYVFPNVKSYFGKTDGETRVENAPDLCMYLLNKAYVALVPGDAFGDPECIRFSYATSNDLLIEAVNRMKKALADLK